MRPTEPKWRARLPWIGASLLLIPMLASAASGAVFQVNTTAEAHDANPGDGVCADATGGCTLRAAVDEANADPGADLVWVPEGTYALQESVDILQGLTLVGSGANRTTITLLDPGPTIDWWGWGVFQVYGPGPVRLEALSVRGIASSEISAGVSAIWSGNDLSQAEIQLRSVVLFEGAVGVWSEAGRLRIEDSAIRGNSVAGVGINGFESCGSICSCSYGRLEVVNSTISENGWAGIWGGTIFGYCGSAHSIDVENGTVASNGRAGIASSGGVSLRGTVVAHNPEGDCSLSWWVDASLGHNLDSDGTCGLTDPTDLSGVDPRLGPLADNGGPTPTHALLPASPALDAIPIADCTYDDDGDSATPEVLLPNDQRGVARPQGAGCDIGAFEATACRDGLDNDGDGFVDYPADPGCRFATSKVERTQCQDGLNNDGQTGIDFDGGASVNGGVPLDVQDPQCTYGWQNKERSGCGLGFELVLIAPLLARLARKRCRLTWT